MVDVLVAIPKCLHGSCAPSNECDTTRRRPKLFPSAAQPDIVRAAQKVRDGLWQANLTYGAPLQMSKRGCAPAG